MKLTQAAVLITGGSSGIGAASVREMIRRGARVSIVDLEPPPPGLLRADDVFTQGDITSADVRAAAVRNTVDRFGRLDVLINNAGVGLYAEADSAPGDFVRRVFEVNVFAALEMAQAALPHLSVARGTIVMMGSIGGQVALPWAAAYCASKFALHAFSDSLRRTLKERGVRVITIMPGVVATGFRTHVVSGNAPARVGELRGMQPARLAQAVCAKIEGSGSTLYKPWFARLFAFADRVCPWVSDLYIRYYSSRYKLATGNANVAAAASKKN